MQNGTENLASIATAGASDNGDARRTAVGRPSAGTAAAAAAFTRIGRTPAILEGKADFRRELSVVAARGIDGAIACYDLVENVHGDHILRR